MYYFHFRIFDCDSFKLLFSHTFICSSLEHLQMIRDFLFELRSFFNVSDDDFIGDQFFIYPIHEGEPSEVEYDETS